MIKQSDTKKIEQILTKLSETGHGWQPWFSTLNNWSRGVTNGGQGVYAPWGSWKKKEN